MYNMHGYFWLPVKGKIKVCVYNTNPYSAVLSYRWALHGEYMYLSDQTVVGRRVGLN